MIYCIILYYIIVYYIKLYYIILYIIYIIYMCVKDTTVCSCEKIHLHPSFRDGFLLMSRPYLTLWRGGFQPRISTYAMFVLID